MCSLAHLLFAEKPSPVSMHAPKYIFCRVNVTNWRLAVLEAIRGNVTLQNSVVPLKFGTRVSLWFLFAWTLCVRFLSVTETHYGDGELQQFRLRPTAGYLKQCELEHSYLSRGWTAITPSATEERKRRGIKGNERGGERQGNEDKDDKTGEQVTWNGELQGRVDMSRKGKEEMRGGLEPDWWLLPKRSSIKCTYLLITLHHKLKYLCQDVDISDITHLYKRLKIVLIVENLLCFLLVLLFNRTLFKKQTWSSEGQKLD